MWFALASLAFSAYQGAQSASAQNSMSAANRDSAITSQMYENRGLNDRQRQSEEVNADKALEMQIQALKQDASRRASGRTVGGVSVQRADREVFNLLGNALSQLDANDQGTRAQLAMDKKGTSANAQSRINSMPKTSYSPVGDILQTGLSIGADFKQTQRQASSNGVAAPTFTEYLKGEWK